MARTGRAVLFATTSPGVCLQYSQVRGHRHRHANRSGGFNQSHMKSISIITSNIAPLSSHAHIRTHASMLQVAYYARQFERDVARVLDRFRQAKGAGLPIYEVRVRPSVHRFE